MNGIIIINKPQDMTSHDVISFMRRKTGIKRIGHSGTLDPMATGVLPIFIGKATRVIQFASEENSNTAKLYRCTMKLGCKSDTQDIWGDVLYGDHVVMPTKAAIVATLNSFVGEITQIPPAYSAIKVDGKKLYEYARKGQVVPEDKIKIRKVNINAITINDIDIENKEVYFDVESSKGLYVRTLCADVGEKLGCGALMSGLERLKSDGFDIRDSYTIEELRTEDCLLPELLPIDYPLNHLTRVDLTPEDAALFMNGISISIGENVNRMPTQNQYIRVYSENCFIGIAEFYEGMVKPYKVFKDF